MAACLRLDAIMFAAVVVKMQDKLDGKHECVHCGKIGYNMVFFLGSWNCKKEMHPDWLKKYYGGE